MSKTVLLIESDTAFSREMAGALESRGFGVRASRDGKEGFELARALSPDCVVLCVELPGLSGYSWCNRLKKDEELRSIPLVITSSEATPETFEQHRKLKTHAEDYLIKPFPAGAIVEHVVALVGAPEPADEERVTLEDVELDAVPADAAAEEDADLRLLDEAFDSIATGTDEPSSRAPGSSASEPPLTLLPDADESPAILDLDREMAEALASLAEEAAAQPVPAVRLAQAPPAEPEETPVLLEDVEVLPSAAELEEAAAALRASQEEARSLRDEMARLQAAADDASQRLGSRDAEAAAMRRDLDAAQATLRAVESELEAARGDARAAREHAGELERELAGLRPLLDEARAEAETIRSRAEEAHAQAEATRTQAEEARSDAERARSEAEEARAREGEARRQAEESRAEAEKALAAAAELRAAVERAEGDATAARSGLGEAEAASAALRSELEALGATVARLRAEAEAGAAESSGLRRSLDEARAAAAQHEDRLLRAYQKIKSDEKVREKTRKALAMVLQVLEDRPAGDGGGSAPPASP